MYRMTSMRKVGLSTLKEAEVRIKFLLLQIDKRTSPLLICLSIHPSVHSSVYLFNKGMGNLSEKNVKGESWITAAPWNPSYTHPSGGCFDLKCYLLFRLVSAPKSLCFQFFGKTPLNSARGRHWELAIFQVNPVAECKLNWPHPISPNPDIFLLFVQQSFICSKRREGKKEIKRKCLLSN